MKRLVNTLVMSLAIAVGGVTVSAHPETYKGTVLTVEAAKLQVKVVDDKTKKETTMEFSVTTKTKIYRGSKTVSFKDAHIQKDERIAVTVNHDVPGHDATEIRLAELK